MASYIGHDYKMRLNDTYTLHDMVTVLDPWTFEQAIRASQDDFLTWFTTKVTYTGTYWEQVFSMDGGAAIYTKFDWVSPDESTMHMTWYPEEQPGFGFT